MAKKPILWRIAPLQFCIGEVVTDPAEIAAMEKVRQRLKRKKAGRKPKRKAAGE